MLSTKGERAKSAPPPPRCFTYSSSSSVFAPSGSEPASPSPFKAQKDRRDIYYGGYEASNDNINQTNTLPYKPESKPKSHKRHYQYRTLPTEVQVYHDMKNKHDRIENVKLPNTNPKIKTGVLERKKHTRRKSGPHMRFGNGVFDFANKRQIVLDTDRLKSSKASGVHLYDEHDGDTRMVNNMIPTSNKRVKFSPGNPPEHHLIEGLSDDLDDHTDMLNIRLSECMTQISNMHLEELHSITEKIRKDKADLQQQINAVFIDDVERQTELYGFADEFESKIKDAATKYDILWSELLQVDREILELARKANEEAEGKNFMSSNWVGDVEKELVVARKEWMGKLVNNEKRITKETETEKTRLLASAF